LVKGLGGGRGDGLEWSPENGYVHTAAPGPRGGCRPAWESGEPPTNAERIAELTQLGRLHDQGVLTDTEFAAEKARVLGE
jgi:hypothetical protein